VSITQFVCPSTSQYSISLETWHSTFAKDIAAQALAYVGAIDFSIVAAQNGFNVTEEAIALGELIPISSPDQLQSYLVGMLKLAKHGHSNASKTLHTFRDVRQIVFAVGQLLLSYPFAFSFSSSALAENTTRRRNGDIGAF
jgi:hypothetical protein